MRIGIIVQRCHASIAAGSERHARLFADYLKSDAVVEILTTNALDSETWKPVLPCGAFEEDGVLVRRFAVSGERTRQWSELNDQLLSIYHSRRSEPTESADFNYFTNRFIKEAGRELIPWPVARQEEWIRAQGPLSRELFDFLEREAKRYDRLLFCTYLYATSCLGSSFAPSDRSYLLPTLHDEPAAYLPVMRSYARRFRGLVYNTEAERRLVRRIWGALPGQIAGMGVDLTAAATSEIAREQQEIGGVYIYYAGRIDRGKGCDLLCEFFRRYREERDGLQLVLSGSLHMELPEHPAIQFAGFVSEERKRALMAGALAFVLPSELESFSIVSIEAMAQGRPVLARASCEVVADHVRASGGGKLFTNYESFATGLDAWRARPDEAGEQGRRGRSYAVECYSHDAVRNRLRAALNLDAAV